MNDEILIKLLEQNQKLIEALASSKPGDIMDSQPLGKERPMPFDDLGNFRPEVKILPNGKQAPQRTLSSHMEEWLSKRAGRVADSHNEYLRWKKHIAPTDFAHLPLYRVRAHHIEDFLDELSKTHSEQTCKHALRQIKQTFVDAQKREHCPFNPADLVRVRKQATTKDAWTYLQPEEIDLIYNSTDLEPLERRGALLAIYTGLRLGELLHLHWEDVHLGGTRPHVVVRYSNGKASKSGKPGRTVLLPMAVEIFQEMVAELDGKPSGLVFESSHGGAYAKGFDFHWRDRKNNAGNLCLGAKTRVGITRDVRFHDLRHTAAAALVSGYWGESWSLEEVRDFMRHSNITMTQRYAHLDPAGLHRKAAKMFMPGDKISEEAGEVWVR